MSPAGCPTCGGAGRRVKLVTERKWGVYVGIPIQEAPEGLYVHARCEDCNGLGYLEACGPWGKPVRSDVEALEAWCAAESIELAEPKIGAPRPVHLAGITVCRSERCPA